MILHFINTNKFRDIAICFIFLSIFFSCKVFSGSRNMFYLPDNTGYIFSKCKDNLCNTYLKKKKNIISLSENSPQPSVNALSQSIVRLFFSCGAPCNYTIFYASKNGVSRAFEFVVATDPNKQLVIVAEKNHLVGYRIFDEEKKPLFSIQREWSPTASLFNNIIEAKFVLEGFYFKYLEGANYNEKVELIKVNIGANTSSASSTRGFNVDKALVL